MTLLEVTGVDVHHGQLQAVRDFNLSVEPGEKVAVIGANGAGKSTLLRAVMGVIPVTNGTIVVDGQDVTRMTPYRRVELGLAMVPEGRRLFKSLTIEENLQTGAYRKRKGDWSLDAIYRLFPWMAERRKQPTTRLSGGEQQAVAIGRALMSNPRVLLIDELSLGLSPAIVKRIYSIVPQIVDSGCAVLFVEQDVSQALAVADYAMCLLEGQTMLAGSANDLDREAVEAAYFGTTKGKE